MSVKHSTFPLLSAGSLKQAYQRRDGGMEGWSCYGQAQARAGQTRHTRHTRHTRQTRQGDGPHLIKHLRHAKVGKLCHAILGEQHVLRLEVSVDHVVPVQELLQTPHRRRRRTTGRYCSQMNQDITKRSPRHHQDITKTQDTHRGRTSIRRTNRAQGMTGRAIDRKTRILTARYDGVHIYAYLCTSMHNAAYCIR